MQFQYHMQYQLRQVVRVQILGAVIQLQEH
jgi:hypothetical protein